MPKLMNTTDTQESVTASNFQYSAVKMEALGATEYTIVQIAVDESGSVDSFKNDLIVALNATIDACKKHPRAENMLVRVIAFGGRNGGTRELHGFIPLNSIDLSIYTSLSPAGGTPLIDATLDCLESLLQYGSEMVQRQYLCNSVLFVITDGVENTSKTKDFKRINEICQILRSGDPIESFASILIGINDAYCSTPLVDFKNLTGFDDYKGYADVSKDTLAKLAKFVSHSVSTASMSLNGGNSQQLSASLKQSQSLGF